MSNESQPNLNRERKDLNLEDGIGKNLEAGKVIYIPYMSDHGYALAGAFRHHGLEVKTLPEPDESCMQYGRQYSEGGECLPFIVTTGQLIKLIEEEGLESDRPAFFMPTSSGPCRFGQYHTAQKLILEELDADVELVSLEAYDSYSMKGLGVSFRRLAWKGIVAVDFLQKALWHTRPYELEEGQTDEVYRRGLERIERGIGARGVGGLMDALDRIREEFQAIEVEEERDKPVIGILGEIYVRLNRFSNSYVVKMVEELGGEARIAPAAEWFYYTNRKERQDGWNERKPVKFIKGWAKDLVQKFDERAIRDKFEPLLSEHDLHEPPVDELAANSDPYISEAYRGEPVLEVGKAVDYAQKGVSGILLTVPFSCMPGAMIISVSNLVREDYEEIPWLNLTFDAQQSTNIRTRLEAFIFQARRYHKNSGTSYNGTRP